MAAPTPMSDFNKSSAKIAQLIAKICHGKTTSYNYTEKKSGKEVTAYKFECFLLGEKEGVYMYGFLKGTQRKVNDAKASANSAGRRRALQPWDAGLRQT